MKFDALDRKIINLIQGDVPVEAHPFRQLAQETGISEQEVVDRIRHLQERGALRRWGAVLRHQRAGYTANAMVAWRVEADQADAAGSMMSQSKHISHCYLRQVPADFGYNLFAMFHARSETELDRMIRDVAEQTGIKDYAVIKSLKEYKKVSMQYI